MEGTTPSRVNEQMTGVVQIVVNVTNRWNNTTATQSGPQVVVENGSAGAATISPPQPASPNEWRHATMS